MTTHLIGIGGAGMSAIARVLNERGETVSGCDREPSALFSALRAEGIACVLDHDPAHVDGIDLLIVSGAIPDDDPEVARARELGIPIQHRAEALAAILADHRQRVVVTGAHGKTTTTSMLAYAAVELGLDPTFLVGGEVRDLGTNARGGESGLAIVEGDESDRSVRLLPAEIAVILNVDLDHLDHYASVEEMTSLLADWAGALPTDGALVLGDEVPIDPPCATLRFGVGPGDGLRALDVEPWEGGIAFRPSRGPERVRLSVPGAHNAGNACAAALVLERLGVDLAQAFATLEGFRGAGRRFEVLGSVFGYTVVDDYAHHPVELRAAIAAARDRAPKRLVVVFQPHMPWRTTTFAEDFADALRDVDLAIVVETYVARGRPDPEASAMRIVDSIGPSARFAKDYRAASSFIKGLARSGDLILFCGAGPVDRIAREALHL